jgi:hypothetical protein
VSRDSTALIDLERLDQISPSNLTTLHAELAERVVGDTEAFHAPSNLSRMVVGKAESNDKQQDRQGARGFERSIGETVSKEG